MDSGLSDLLPRPTKVVIRDALGRPRLTYWLEPITINSLVWAAREFETSPDAEDGLGRLEVLFLGIAQGRLTAEAMEAVLKLSHRLILKKPFFQRDYKRFRRKHYGKAASIIAFTAGLSEAFRRGSAEPDDHQSGTGGQKKKTA